jgi:hypothetical protein
MISLSACPPLSSCSRSSRTPDSRAVVRLARTWEDKIIPETIPKLQAHLAHVLATVTGARPCRARPARGGGAATTPPRASEPVAACGRKL